MALQEGFLRIKKLARVLSLTGALLLLLWLVVVMLRPGSTEFPGLGLMALIVGEVGVLLPVLGIILTAAAWIGEGFADKDSGA